MNAYNITEPELDSINLMSTIAMIAFSFAGWVLGIWFDLKKDFALTEKIPPEAKALDQMVSWLGMPLAIAAAGIAIWALWKKGTIVRKIKDDSYPVIT